MSTKFKTLMIAPRLAWWNRKARSIAKKYKKYEEDDKYPILWRSNYILKRFKKLMKAGNVEVEIIGYKNLPKAPAVLAPNHASSMDPGFILMALENPSKTPEDKNGIPIFLAKDDVQKDKRGRGYADMLDTFYIDRKKIRQSVEQMDAMGKFAKKEKRYQVIFPEGTRSKDGKLLEFKGGAFRNAKKGYIPIVPVTINNALSVTNLNRGKLKVQVIIHKAIKPVTFISQDTKSIAANVQKIVQKALKKPEGKRSSDENKS